MHSQSKEDLKAQRRQMVEKAKQQNAKGKLNVEQTTELEKLSSSTFSLMNYPQNTETLAETQSYYVSVDPNIFETFMNKFKEYKEQGVELNIYEHMVTSQIPEFLKGKAFEVLENRFKGVKEKVLYLNADGPNSTDKAKEQAMADWKLLAVHTNFFSQYNSYDSRLTGLNDQVAKEVAKYESAFESKYAKYVTTPLHKKYREKVVLAYKPIAYGEENEQQFLDEVIIDSEDKGLHFMYYSNVPNKEYLKDQWGKKKQYVMAQLQLDGDVGYAMSSGCLVLLWDKAYDLNDTEEEQAYLSLPVFSNADEYKRDKWLDPTYYRFLQCLTNISLNQPHKARLVFGFPGTNKQFEKHFELTITEAGRKGMIKVMEKIEYEKLKEVRMGKPGAMHNTENINIVKAAAQKKGFNVKRVVITGDRYNVYKDSHYPYDIKNKACNAELAYEEDGRCYVREFQIVREYQGGGSYGSPFVPFQWGTKQGILCENIAK